MYTLNIESAATILLFFILLLLIINTYIISININNACEPISEPKVTINTNPDFGFVPRYPEGLHGVDEIANLSANPGGAGGAQEIVNAPEENIRPGEVVIHDVVYKPGATVSPGGGGQDYKDGARGVGYTEMPKETKPPRWRAEEGNIYYFISDVGEISVSTEYHVMFDNFRYNTGNYFSTEKEAKQYRESLLAKHK